MSEVSAGGSGVAVFVLRSAGHQTQVLLLERAHGEFAGEWCPVAGHPKPGEREADAALRELHEETGLRPSRFYAAPFAEWIDQPGSSPSLRLAIFVAFAASTAEVALDREHTDSAWLDFPAAMAALPLAQQRGALGRVREEFVARPPDEALRLA